MNKVFKRYFVPLLVFLGVTFLAGCSVLPNSGSNGDKNTYRTTSKSEYRTSRNGEKYLYATAMDAPKPSNENKEANQSHPDFTKLKWNGNVNDVVIQVNNNKPTFNSSELSTSRGAWQQFSNLDNLNRARTANAMLNRSLMPRGRTRERLFIRPTAWHFKKAPDVPGGTLYNRCHLIGYQFTGQNNNPKNLVTGTRACNASDHAGQISQQNYENAVADYLRQTGHDVRYQVEPVYKGNDLMASGIHLMGQSIQDSKISFNVYIFNVQPGYTLNYSNGFTQKN